MRRLVLVVFLSLLLLPIANPSPYAMPLARGIESNEKPFFAAADGGESTESIPSFSETSDDDTMMYSDIEQAETNQYGFSSGVSLENTISVHSMNCSTDDFVAFNYPEGGAGGATSNTADMLNISSPSDHVYVTWFQCEGYIYHTTLAFYLNDASGGPWTLNYYYGASWTSHATVNFTTSDIGSVVEFDMSSWPYFGTGRYEFEFETAGWIELDWSIVTENPDYELDSWGGYTESFANVSDWTTSDTSISTDGDVATITENGAGSTGRAYASFTSTNFFEYYYEFRIESMTATTSNLEFWDGAAYNTLKTFTAAGTYNGIISDADAATMQRIGFLVGSEGGNVKPDYLRVGKSTEMGWSHSGSTTAGVASVPVSYEEDFSDVSDWTMYAGESGMSTAGGWGYFDVEDDNAYDRYWSNGPSIPAGVSTDWMITIKANDTPAYFGVYAYSTDGYGSGSIILYPIIDYIQVAETTFTGTYDGTYAIECVVIIAKALTAGHPVRVSIDTLQIGRASQMDDTGTCTSDGNELTLTADADGTTFGIQLDTTATQAMLDTDYYPMLALDFNDADSADYVMVESYDGTAWAPVIANGTIGTDTLRANIKAVDDDIEAFWLSIAPSAVVRLDWCKAYSIANFTYTGSGVGLDDYLYADSSVLYSSIDDGYIELNHDPALSVSDTYSVYNLTTSSTVPEFSQYVSEWSAYSDETRGATTSGTVTDIKLKFDSTEIISAIKFIEDGTAPDILDKFIGPPEPDDSEAVTITAVTYDAVEVYEVTINAVVYPTGFSDVDYDATEQTTDVLWSYEFSTLTAGYYLFQITASDGANTYSEYMPVTVRVSAIEISTYTFFGASSDFDYMQYSGHISHDCTYNISEWSTTWAKNETHTGSVTEGMFNIAWDKIGVDDAEANFTIVFVSGTLSLTIEGFYGTAYKALQVTEIDFVNLEQSDSWTTNLTINFYTNKEVDWTVYDRDNDDAVLHSGTTTEGDGFITWVQNTARGAHQFAVKWTDSISDQWYNNSYWVFDRNIDDLPGGADPGKDQRRTIEFWATVGAIAGILGIIVIGLSHYNLDEMIKNLPNYRTQERGRK